MAYSFHQIPLVAKKPKYTTMHTTAFIQQQRSWKTKFKFKSKKNNQYIFDYWVSLEGSFRSFCF